MEKIIQFQKFSLIQIDRAKQKKQKPMFLWITSSIGTSKTAIGNALDNELYKMKKYTYILDEVNLQYGLNSDFNFSKNGNECERLDITIDTQNMTINGCVQKLLKKVEIS
jgi:adenylylsulfate kinase-like enzyme